MKSLPGKPEGIDCYNRLTVLVVNRHDLPMRIDLDFNDFTIQLIFKGAMQKQKGPMDAKKSPQVFGQA
jgi:hypothetical protein